MGRNSSENAFFFVPAVVDTAVSCSRFWHFGRTFKSVLCRICDNENDGSRPNAPFDKGGKNTYGKKKIKPEKRRGKGGFRRTTRWMLLGTPLSWFDTVMEYIDSLLSPSYYNEGESSSVPLVAFGNPLWDVCIRLPNKNVLSQFDLADDSAKEVTAAEYELLLSAVQGYPIEGCPGGAALNTLRVFQWLVPQNPNSSVFFGSIGNDDIGIRLSNHISQAGVNGRFKIRPSLLTGSALCLIHDNMRSLVAHLGAADVYCQEDLTPEDKIVIAGATLIYIENFFFSHSPAVIWDVVKLCKIHGVAIAFNLSSSYLFDKHAIDIVSLVKCVNVVVGNESEFSAFAQSSGWMNVDISKVACAISNEGVQTPEFLLSTGLKAIKLVQLQHLGKVVVVTRGSKPVFCVSQENSAFLTPVLKPKSEVKDTTGAGDAFVAGLLKGILLKLPLQQCVLTGCYASVEIIQQIGCNPPNHMPLTMHEILSASPQGALC